MRRDDIKVGHYSEKTGPFTKDELLDYRNRLFKFNMREPGDHMDRFTYMWGEFILDENKKLVFSYVLPDTTWAIYEEDDDVTMLYRVVAVHDFFD